MINDLKLCQLLRQAVCFFTKGYAGTRGKDGTPGLRVILYLNFLYRQHFFARFNFWDSTPCMFYVLCCFHWEKRRFPIYLLSVLRFILLTVSRGVVAKMVDVVGFWLFPSGMCFRLIVLSLSEYMSQTIFELCTQNEINELIFAMMNAPIIHAVWERNPASQLFTLRVFMKHINFIVWF